MFFVEAYILADVLAKDGASRTNLVFVVQVAVVWFPFQ